MYNIRQQARDNVKARLADIHDVDEAPEASVEDLSDRLGLAVMGLVDDDEPEDLSVISKKSLNVFPTDPEGTLDHIGCSRGLGARIRR